MGTRRTSIGGLLGAAGVAVLALLQAGCLVEVHHVADAETAFRTARAEVERDRGRHGRAHRLNVLVFDPSERELVRVSMPIWLARRLQGHVHWGEGGPAGGGEREDRMERRLARHLRVEDLAAAGPGLIADVEDDDGSQVLVWLR
jgi:hypothetical protein